MFKINLIPMEPHYIKINAILIHLTLLNQSLIDPKVFLRFDSWNKSNFFIR